jgi:hypothetical protein
MERSVLEKSKLDLRAPLSTKLRQDTYAVWLRLVTLLVGDLSFLSLAWMIAVTYGTPVDSFLRNPTALLVVLPLEVGIIAARGLYQSGERRCDYLGLTKAIILAHILLLVVAFLYQPNLLAASRSTYLLSAICSVLLVCADRFGIDLLLKVNLR